MTQWGIQCVIGVGFGLQAAIAVPAVGAGVGFLVVTATAWIVQWAWVWLAYRIVMGRPWWSGHPAVKALVILLITVVSAVISVIVLPAWSVTDGWTVLWRWVITLLVTALMVVLADYRHDVERERLLQEELRDAREQASTIVEAEREGIVSRLLEMLQQAFDATAPSHAGSERLERFAREQVRPLSHELAQAMPPMTRGGRGAPERSTWREVIADATSRPLVRPWTMAIAVTVLYVLTTVQLTTGADTESGTPDPPTDQGVGVTVDLANLVQSLGSLGLVFIVTLGVSWFAVRLTTPVLPRLGLALRVLIAVVTVAAIGFLVVLVVRIAVTQVGLRPDMTRSLGEQLLVSLPVVAVAFSIVITRSLVALLRQSTRRVRDLTDELEWETTRLNNALSQERHFFATQLHGPIQSAVAAAALRLHASEVSPEALSQVRVDLQSAVQALGEGPPRTRRIESDLEDLVATWMGVCDVRIDIPDSVVSAIDGDWITVGTVRDLLVDAVANAAMHGRASNAWIEADWDARGEIEFVITDDGTAGLGEGSGLGSALLDSTCVRWSRVQGEDGVCLRAVVVVPDV